jgi:hypothetical protein
VRTQLNESKVIEVADMVALAAIPEEAESRTHSFRWTRSPREHANAYLAIVAICHQTSPIGERQLKGELDSVSKSGWDYLKEKFLIAAVSDETLVTPSTWAELTPTQLSDLYVDTKHGLTLNRVVERTQLLNDLGRWMKAHSIEWIEDEYERRGRRFLGPSGLLATLQTAAAYSDPVQKKSFFFSSLAIKECRWTSKDFDQVPSPVDYHELRGHLRMGTVKIVDVDLAYKVQRALPISSEEDVDIRSVVQQANDLIAARTGLSSSRIHYLMWNVFRECCPRISSATHCSKCGPSCTLPSQYKQMPGYQGRCAFAGVCESAERAHKVIEPPYVGHYY